MNSPTLRSTTPGPAANGRGRATLVVGQATFAASQGAMLIAIARLEGADAVGLYTWALAVVSPIFLLLTLRLQDVLATDPDAQARAAQYLRLTAIGSVVAVIASVVVAGLWGDPRYVGTTAWLAVGKLAESISFITYGHLQGNGRFDTLGRNLAVRGVVGTVALAAGTAAAGLQAGVAALAIAWLVNAADDLRRYPVTLPSLMATTRRDLLGDWVRVRHLLPLGMATLLISANQSAIRLVIETRVGLDVLGVYATVAYSVRAGVVAVRSASQALSPELRRLAARGDVDQVWCRCRRLGLQTLALGGTIAGLTVAVGPTLYATVFGAEFRPSRMLFGLVGMAGMALYAGMPITMGLVAMGEHRGQLSVLVATLVATIPAAIVLTGRYGVEGAAAAWAGGELVRLVGLAATLRRGTTSPTPAPGAAP